MADTVRLRVSKDRASLLHALTDEQISQILSAVNNGKGVSPQHTFLTPPVLELYKKPSWPKPYVGNPNNVFVVPDLHAPFTRANFLAWCREKQEQYDCGTVVFIGDIVDQHAISYHESDPDGMSAGQELTAAREVLAQVFAMFPTAKCCLGNHDLLISRKARTAGLSQNFVKSIAEVYDAPPTWEFGHEFIINDVRYIHGGIGGNAEKMATFSRISTVQGHLHTLGYVKWLVSERDAIFAMQVGCGMDDKSYAAAYGRDFAKRSVIGAGVVLDGGKTPISLLMNL